MKPSPLNRDDARDSAVSASARVCVINKAHNGVNDLVCPEIVISKAHNGIINAVTTDANEPSSVSRNSQYFEKISE